MLTRNWFMHRVEQLEAFDRDFSTLRRVLIADGRRRGQSEIEIRGTVEKEWLEFLRRYDREVRPKSC